MNDLVSRDLNLLNDSLKSISLKTSSLEVESEGKEYGACSALINNRKVLIRTAKVTPKKIGLFVTLWKRDEEGVTRPHHEDDEFDLVIINVRANGQSGHFIFSKQTLIDQKVVSTSKVEGKRGFRVYPSWDEAISTQAKRTQNWQTSYFIRQGEENESLLKSLLQ